ncbi:hypothetical protein EXIGLDRAFT_830966 [Exidia glandulosa HHB12029]|uniref:Nucleotide-diphospho-sugar transferase domain-containing protein n=1 Tax=Exidia glandulosa HHB12029 TaxID=1314781 RepID=A0A165N755_EXIGL|nr:hypothetical protein EXIGLDRAFT_830966 [Exidia glandulosa HHB12029]
MRELAFTPPSRKVIAGIAAVFISLFLINASVQGPSVHELVSSATSPLSFPSFFSGSSGSSQDGELEKIAIVMVMFGLGSAQEGQHMVKSILMRASRPVDIHIVCSADAMTFLQSRLDLVKRPAHDVYVQFYVVGADMIKERAKRAGTGSIYHAGPGGLVKMFLHEIVLIPQAVYVDTDAFFAVDPYILWSYLTNMTSTTEILIAFPHAGPTVSGPSLICSCVMAMNFEEMRNQWFMPSTLVPGTEKTGLANLETYAMQKMNPKEPPYGDQGILYAVWRRFPERFWRLSRAWDITGCQGGQFYSMGLAGEAVGADAISLEAESKSQKLGSEKDDAIEGAIFPGIIHYNCMGGEESVFEMQKLMVRHDWGPMLLSVVRYKWVWLNTGTATLRTHVVQENEIRFYDELHAATLRK